MTDTITIERVNEILRTWRYHERHIHRAHDQRDPYVKVWIPEPFDPSLKPRVEIDQSPYRDCLFKLEYERISCEGVVVWERVR